MAAGAAVLRALWAPLPRTLTAVQVPLLPGACALAASPHWRKLCVRRLQQSSALCAGHNKWSKVKNVKGPKDAERARLFAKFSVMIKVAVREGGPNPAFNHKLAHVMEQCRSRNMPKTSVEAAIQSASQPMSQHMFEARGPGGCLLLIEVLTNSISRTNHEVKHLLARNGAVVSDGARHGFSRKGVVALEGGAVSTERALELAIEAGAEDVEETVDEEDRPLLKFICESTEMNNVRTSLEALGLHVISSEVEFIPRTQASLGPQPLDNAYALVQALTNCPDVVRVWDNIQAAD